MDVKGPLKAISLELRWELEGKYDPKGAWQPGDLERRLAAMGVRRDRASVPLDELPHLSPEDREARRVVDAFLQSRAEAEQSREAAIAEFVRDLAYTWANRLLALRCMEARGLIDEVILQKDAYGGRSLQHNRLAKKQPERCAGEDEGLFAALFDEFARRAEELPLLFDPRAPEVALRPSVAALKRCIAILSGTIVVKGQEPAIDEVFTAPDALGWAYQYWNTEEKDRVFEKVRTKKGSKIEGAEIIPATCIYTEPYMVKFLVQNSLGAIWMGMHPNSRLVENWDYFVRGADRAPVSKRPAAETTFLDPACGSGHFLIEAFELLYGMYLEEGALTDPAEICASILERNLYGIDIDERAVQIAALALVMKAKEKAPDFVPRRVNLVATNIHLAAGKEHFEAFLLKHPEDAPLKPALLAIFDGLAHADEIGSLLQIEELVDRELRHLRDQQLARERKTGAGMLFGPRTDEEWSAWKQEVVGRLREHFSAEPQETDLAAAFFGEAASKGLSLVDLLSRRYDVVAANPPYMGSKNMGPSLKNFVERHFAAGKRDLYAAFILRCLELAADGGRVAMVTQHSWMFLRSFADLRALDEEKRKKAPKAFGGVLRETGIEELAHLGEHAFHDSAAAGAFVALFVLIKGDPEPDHRLTAFRLVGPKSPEEKSKILINAAKKQAASVIFQPIQKRLENIPESPLSYWLTEGLLDCLLLPRRLRDVADIRQGMATTDNPRFLRYVWEYPGSTRWVPYAKGGGYLKWTGFENLAVDWHPTGTRLKEAVQAIGGQHWSRRLASADRYFQAGLTYTLMARGSMGCRELPKGCIFDVASMSIFPIHSEPIEWLGSVLNSHCASFLLRVVTQDLKFHAGYVANFPLPDEIPTGVFTQTTTRCTALKRRLIASDITERGYVPYEIKGASLSDIWCSVSDEALRLMGYLHTLEAQNEAEVADAYNVEGDDLSLVLAETGTPAGWFPLFTGYDAIPALPPGLPVAAEITELAHRERRTLSAQALAELKRRLRAAYEAGPGGRVDEEDDDTGNDDDADESEASVSGARIPIPAETFLEELSQKLEIHPISVYWLLRELREKERAVSRPELVRFVEDYVSVLVLRLLGHRWPREVEAKEPLPAWVDQDGIVPLTEGMNEPALVARVRARLASDFGAERPGAIEREFQEITGKPLAAWLASDFFKRHISQFRKRPIAWQLSSLDVSNAKRRGRGASQSVPTFSCLIYYHRLDTDLLPKLRTHYIGPLRTSLQTELGSLEKMRERSADRDARRLELEGTLEELKAFDARLEQVLALGFTSPTLDEIAAKEPLDKWTSRDGRARAPETRDAFLAQERRYDPDLNDGVRVNIAPLQRAGLVAADVLSAKDVDKPIADRAEWRADERRWCREGKLPQPGWWPVAVKTLEVPAPLLRVDP